MVGESLLISAPLAIILNSTVTEEVQQIIAILLQSTWHVRYPLVIAVTKNIGHARH
jgi:hypothetical protein